MRQVFQRLDSGGISLVEAPVPVVQPRGVLVQSGRSLISAGTERMLLGFGRSGWIQKARTQPDKVRAVIQKVRTDGVSTTLEAVRAKLSTPIPLGYCNAGTVVEVGEQTAGFRIGDRVVTNGPHSEYVMVPETLAARIPDGVDLDAAAFTPIASIGLQGIRLAEPTLGETVVVFGLGLVGLLTVQLLRANGCRVIGIDRQRSRLELAQVAGAQVLDGTETDVVQGVMDMTDSVGADAVLLTLASDSDAPMREAAKMSRKRGRLVLVGVTGLNLTRDDFYQKELSFRVSCSYGPGRYDPRYEDQAVDYPLPYVRWTEQRNFAAILELMKQGSVDPQPLVTHRFPFAQAGAAYDVLGGAEDSLGILLEYPAEVETDIAAAERTITLSTSRPEPAAGTVGVIGAGNFGTRMLIPLLKKHGVRLRTIASAVDASAAIAADKFGFEVVTSEVNSIFTDELIDTVFVLTRHDSHAGLVVRALESGKNVFVEKPLALSESELEDVRSALNSSGRLLTVGFNRRFAPLASEMRSMLTGRSGPVSVVVTVNAGSIPRDHWTQDPLQGGGRIAGEACHFIDLSRYLVGSPILDLQAVAVRDREGNPIDDVAHLLVSFEDGSNAVVHYLANGSSAFPKERIEVFFDGRTAAIDNWRRVRRYGEGRGRGLWRAKQDKGHEAEVLAWIEAVRKGGPEPIPVGELFEVSDWTLKAAALAQSRSTC